MSRRGGLPREKGTSLRPFLVMVSVTVLLIAGLLLLSPSLFRTDAVWWDQDWAYRRAVRIISRGDVDLVDHQIRVRLNTRALMSAGKMAEDGADLRFVGESGEELPYWIESGLNTADTVIWVKVPEIDTGDRGRMYLYYGNPYAEAGANGTLTFDFFSSFEAQKELALGEGFARFSKEPLLVEAYDAKGVVHPDVLYFPQGVDGYEYWMYYTPYPPDNCELPTLVRSKNGINFTDDGVTNPLIGVGEPGQWDDGLLADPEVVKVGSKWYLFYAGRSANKSWQRIGLATSTDGKHFAKHPMNPVLQADLNLDYEAHDYLLSPTVYHNDTGFYMWYFSEGREGNETRIWLCGAKSDDGTSWEKLPGNPLLGPRPSSFDRKGLWHGDVIYLNGAFWLYYVAHDGSDFRLCLAKSIDGVGWERSEENPVLDILPDSWEDLRIYRSSPVAVGDEIHLYYSAFNSSFVPRIGLAKSWQGLEVTRPDLSGWETEGYAYCSRFHARGSEYSVTLVPKGDRSTLSKDLSGNFDCSVWFYDDLDNQTGHGAFLKAGGEGLNSAVGVGVSSDLHPYYVLFGKPYGEEASCESSGVARSVGWHKLSLRLTPDSTVVFVDDDKIGETSALDAYGMRSFSIEGGLAGLAHFDDVTVRKYSSPEPKVKVGPEERA